MTGGSDRPERGPADAGRHFDGTDGNDMIAGGSGDDTITAGAGDDYVNSGRGADLVDLGAGDDRLAWNPSTGNDTAQGGDGTDTLIVSNHEISLQDLLASIQPDPGSPAPFIDANGMISLAGVSGTIAIGDAILVFSGFERLFINA